MYLPVAGKRILYYVLGTISAGFVVLSALVFLFPTPNLDIELSEKVQRYQTPLLDNLMKAVSWFGYIPNSPIVVIATALLFMLYQHKREALFLLLTMLSGLVSTIVKFIVNRPRPSAPFVKIMGANMQQSFPSGHVLFYILFFGFVTLLMYQLKAIPKPIRLSVSSVCLLLIFTVPLSRIYLGAHWFTDVLGAFLLGILCLYTLSYFYLRRPEKR